MKKNKITLKTKTVNFQSYVINNIKKDFGKDAVVKMGDKAKIDKGAIIAPTGYLPFDYALGIMGLPKGRIVEIYGAESTGKTTFTIHATAEVQKVGGDVAFLDCEHSLDLSYAKSLGVNVNNLILSQPDNAEQTIDLICSLIELQSSYKSEHKKDKPLLIVIDSVAAMIPKAEIEGTLEDGDGGGLGLHARIMSKGLRKIINILKDRNVCIIFINQIRNKIGGWGSNITTTGGNSLKFYASIRMSIFSNQEYKEKTKQVGRKIKVRIVKHKLAPPFKEFEAMLRFGIGIDKSWHIFETLKTENIIANVSKGWLEIDPKYKKSFGKFVGAIGFVKIFEQDKEFFMKLYEEIMDKENE